MDKIILITPTELKALIKEAIEEYHQEKDPIEVRLNKGENEVKYYSRKETAKMLHVSIVTLHKFTKKGLIQSHRIGNRVIYKNEDIEKAIIHRNFGKPKM